MALSDVYMFTFSEGGLVRFLPAAGGSSTEKAEAGADEPLTDQRKSKGFTHRGHGDDAERHSWKHVGTCASDA